MLFSISYPNELSSGATHERLRGAHAQLKDPFHRTVLRPSLGVFLLTMHFTQQTYIDIDQSNILTPIDMLSGLIHLRRRRNFLDSTFFVFLCSLCGECL